MCLGDRRSFVPVSARRDSTALFHWAATQSLLLISDHRLLIIVMGFLTIRWGFTTVSIGPNCPVFAD